MVRRALHWAAHEVLATAGVVVGAVRSPRHAYRSLTLFRAIVLVVFCFGMQAVVLNSVALAKPAFLLRIYVASEKAGTPAAQAELNAADRLASFARNRSIAIARDGTEAVCILTIIWFLVGRLTLSRSATLAMAFFAMALAEVISAAGSLLNLLLWLAMKASPGRFTLEFLAPRDSIAASYLANVKIFSVWWALVAGVGLSEAWRRPSLIVIPLVLVLLCQIV